MMDLREIKKEVRNLGDIEVISQKFQDNWVKPLRRNTNNNLPFLKNIEDDHKREINQKIANFKSTLEQVKQGQRVNEKLNHYSRYLIELKLTEIQQDHQKSKQITNTLLNDDFLNIKQTIVEVDKFKNDVKQLSEHYDDVNQLLQKKLSLDETLFFMDLPHKIYLHNLLQISKKQGQIVRHLGRHFVSLVKKTQLRKR
jgi:hypothetical protein